MSMMNSSRASWQKEVRNMLVCKPRNWPSAFPMVLIGVMFAR